MKHSLIIPTFNRRDLLERAVSSALYQSFALHEIIVVDDGSTDTTAEFMESLVGKYSQIHYIYQENKGVSSARNVGVQSASGDWIHFLDSDDQWLPNKVESQVELLQKHPELLWLHGEEVWFRNGKFVNPKKKHQKTGGDIFVKSLELCLVSPSTVCIAKKLFESIGGFNEDFVVCEDYDLWLRIALDNKIGFVSKPIINKYGGHADQLSQKYRAMDYYRVLAMHGIKQDIKDEELLRQINLVLKKKCEILLTGYIKHNNLNNYAQIDSIYRAI